MSSRSSGTTNVRLTLSMIARVRPSQLCSTSLIASAFDMSGGSLDIICFSRREPSRISLPSPRKSSKKCSERGIRLNATDTSSGSVRRPLSGPPWVQDAPHYESRGIVADLTGSQHSRYIAVTSLGDSPQCRREVPTDVLRRGQWPGPGGKGQPQTSINTRLITARSHGIPLGIYGASTSQGETKES